MMEVIWLTHVVRQFLSDPSQDIIVVRARGLMACRERKYKQPRSEEKELVIKAKPTEI